MTLTGLYFDGQSAQSHSVELTIDSAGVLSASPSLFEPIALEEITLSSRIGNIARTLTFPNGAMIETNDHDVLEEWLADNQISSGRTHLLENSFKYVLVAVVFMVGFVAWSAIYGIPIFSKYAAYALPDDINNHIGKGTMESLDERFFDESELPMARQQRLTEKFEKMIPASSRMSAIQYKLLFRDGKGIGANAMALPDGTIIVTDQLIALADNDEEIYAVLLHEIGHVEHRHSLRQVISHSSLAVLTVLITGDVSSAGALVLALPNILVSSSYSRDFEWEADGYALEHMQEHGIGADKFASFMTKLASQSGELNDCEQLVEETQNVESQQNESTESHSDCHSKDGSIMDWFDYIASHPPSKDRIERFEQAEVAQ